ncbi:MAG: universal stress protein [Thermotogae bacterium]|nr:universal stress protein [Thermotogota bacterium]
MKRRIVWATDFSNYSRSIGTFLKVISEKEETEILLLHVFPDIATMYGPFIPQTPNIISAWEEAREKAEKELKRWESEWKRKGLNLTAHLAIGKPVEQTIREAVKFRAGCIAVGTRGVSGFRAFIVGSFAKDLLHASPIPVLTVRLPHIKLQRILVPIDFSKATDFVLKYLPKIESLGKITLFHAVVVDFPLSDSEKKEMEQSVLERMPDYPNAEKEVYVVYDRALDIVGAITSYAERRKYDLIVQTSHGRGGIEKVIFGSVAEGVIARSRIPVLTLNMRTMKVELLR